MRTHVLALCLVLTACSSTADTSNPDAYVPPVDASTMDTGVDLGPRDLGVDLGQPDTGVDLGPACECSTGPCCDGCWLLPADTICADVYVSSRCSSLGGAQTVAWTTTARQFCDGVTSGCTSTPVNVSTPDYCDFESGRVCRTLTGRALCQ